MGRSRSEVVIGSVSRASSASHAARPGAQIGLIEPPALGLHPAIEVEPGCIDVIALSQPASAWQAWHRWMAERVTEHGSPAARDLGVAGPPSARQATADVLALIRDVHGDAVVVANALVEAAGVDVDDVGALGTALAFSDSEVVARLDALIRLGLAELVGRRIVPTADLDPLRGRLDPDLADRLMDELVRSALDRVANGQRIPEIETATRAVRSRVGTAGQRARLFAGAAIVSVDERDDDDALDWLRRAVAEVVADPSDLEAIDQVGRAASYVKRSGVAVSGLEIEDASHPGHAALQSLWLMDLVQQGEVHRAASVAGAEVGGAVRAETIRALALAGRTSEAGAAFARLIEESDPSGWLDDELTGLVDAAWLLGAVREAGPAIDAMTAFVDRLPRSDAVVAVARAALWHAMNGEVRRSLRLLDALWIHSDASSMRQWGWLASHARAIADLHRGRPLAAIADLDALGPAPALMAETASIVRELAGARAAIASVRPLARSVAPGLDAAWAIASAERALADAAPDAAAAVCAEALHHADALGLPAFSSWMWLVAARAGVSPDGDTIERVRDSARRMPTVLSRVHALTAEGLMRRAPEPLITAADLAEQHGLVTEVIVARAGLARMLDDHALGSEVYRLALTTELAGLRDELRTWLGSVTDRVPRAERTVQPASPIESILELVVRGQSNREIAAAVHLSVKRVEALLSRAYREHGVRSRTELAAKLRERPR